MSMTLSSSIAEVFNGLSRPASGTFISIQNVPFVQLIYCTVGYSKATTRNEAGSRRWWSSLAATQSCFDAARTLRKGQDATATTPRRKKAAVYSAHSLPQNALGGYRVLHTDVGRR